MSDLELLECAQSVYEYLIDDTDASRYKSISDIPANKKMNETLSNYGLTNDIVVFTIMLNNKFKIYEDFSFRSYLRNNPRDFFSSTNSLDFYTTILRELKLNICLS